MAKLDAIDTDDSVSTLSADDLVMLRRQLSESQSLIRETAERLRQSQEEAEIASRRRDDVEQRLSTLEAEYEELLEKTIHDEESTNIDLANSMAELKVRSVNWASFDHSFHGTDVKHPKTSG
jgi:kinesin family member 5